MKAKLSFLPANEKIRAVTANIYGEDNVRILDNEIVLLKKPQDKNLYPITMGKEQLTRQDDIKSLADYIIENLNDEFEDINREKIVGEIIKRGLPPIYSELGIISELQMFLSEFSFGGNLAYRKQVLCKELLPLILEKFAPHSCVFTNVDINLQQSIFSLLRVGLQIHEHGQEKAIELINNNVGMGMTMTAGQPILAMLDAYTCLASSHYTLPLHLTSSSFHFLFDGAVTLSSGMRYSLQNLFQAGQEPMLEERDLKYSLPAKVKLDHNYAWRYLRFSVDCVNNLMSYANNPFHFLNEENQLLPERQLQFFTALYLIYADITSINHTTNKHIQYHLAFSAIEKIANLILGHTTDKKPANGASPVKESNIAHIILSSKTGTEIQNIIENSIGELKPDVAANLTSLTKAMYSKLHSKLKNMFKGDEKKNIGKFYNFRKFYAHGSFLDHNLFKETFMKTTATIPSEIIFIPYCLMLALSCNTERFFRYFQEEIHTYNYEEYKEKT